MKWEVHLGATPVHDVPLKLQEGFDASYPDADKATKAQFTAALDEVATKLATLDADPALVSVSSDGTKVVVSVAEPVKTRV